MKNKLETSGKQELTPAAQRTQTGRQVGEKCKQCRLMRPKAPRVGDKFGIQVGDKCGKQVEDKCKAMRPKAPRLGDQCGRQV